MAESKITSRWDFPYISSPKCFVVSLHFAWEGKLGEKTQLVVIGERLWTFHKFTVKLVMASGRGR